MTAFAGQIEANRGKDSYFYYGFTTLRESEKLYDFFCTIENVSQDLAIDKGLFIYYNLREGY